MEPTMPGTLEQRIRARAHQIWEQEGRPQGRERDHWEKARILVSIEDDKSSLKPVEPERPEPASDGEPRRVPVGSDRRRRSSAVPVGEGEGAGTEESAECAAQDREKRA
jgi:Protein of unknown function (DUF2934)